jgi:basic amino acid/polyamine antiporter, APA family
MPETNSPQKKLNLVDATMIIIGSMIGSGIFIVSADITRKVGSPGMLLLVWVVTAVITILAALSYGELAAMMPKAGGQYIYLKEAYNPMFGFLYGWTFFAVIQTGTIAAVAVAFASFSGVFFPVINAIPLLKIGFLSLSTQKIIGIICIVILTLLNFKDVKTGALVQNLFTFAKIGALLLMIILGLSIGFAGKGDWGNFSPAFPDIVNLGTVSIFCAAMVGSLFSSDAWNNITFTAGEVAQPQRNLPLSLILGTGTVSVLYLLANVAYIYILPFNEIQHAENNRVGTVLMQKILGDSGKFFMAAMIMISTFGCVNGLVLAGGRVYFAMAKDKLFFPQAAKLNKNNVPANALIFQCIWACVLTLSGSYGELLDFMMFTVVLFYILTVIGIFILRKTQPDTPRPYKTIGYPVVPALYIVLAFIFCISLLLDEKSRNWSLSGLAIVAIGVPVYFLLLKNKTTPN